MPAADAQGKVRGGDAGDGGQWPGSRWPVGHRSRREYGRAVPFDEVRRMALSLDDVEEGTSYGTPAFKVRGALFVRLREDENSLVVRTTADQREEMLEADPDTYYIADHYLNYPWVLVRLSRVHPDAMRDLLHMAWQLAGSTKRKTAAPRRAGARPRRARVRKPL
jgi:hypothetical protein